MQQKCDYCGTIHEVIEGKFETNCISCGASNPGLTFVSPVSPMTFAPPPKPKEPKNLPAGYPEDLDPYPAPPKPKKPTRRPPREIVGR